MFNHLYFGQMKTIKLNLLEEKEMNMVQGGSQSGEEKTCTCTCTVTQNQNNSNPNFQSVRRNNQYPGPHIGDNDICIEFCRE